MPITSVANNNTIEEWRVITNQLATAVNKLTEGSGVVTGNLTINPSDTANCSLNVANGFIRGNGSGLTAIQNTAITGLLRNSQLQNNSFSVLTSNGVVVTSGSTALGGNINITLQNINVLSNTRPDLPLSANMGNVLNQVIISSFDQANTSLINSQGAFNQANNSNITAIEAFNRANTGVANAATAQALGVSAFNQANTGVTNAATAQSLGVSAFNQANIANTNAITAQTIAVSAFDHANTKTANASAAQANAGFSDIVAITPLIAKYLPNIPKVICTFQSRSTNGLCTIDYKYGVANVARISTGKYSVRFNTPFLSANNMAVSLTAQADTSTFVFLMSNAHRTGNVDIEFVESGVGLNDDFNTITAVVYGYI